MLVKPPPTGCMPKEHSGGCPRLVGRQANTPSASSSPSVLHPYIHTQTHPTPPRLVPEMSWVSFPALWYLLGILNGTCHRSTAGPTQPVEH